MAEPIREIEGLTIQGMDLHGRGWAQYKNKTVLVETALPGEVVDVNVYRKAKGARPADFADMKALFPALDKVGRFHVFDIGGNKLRLIAIVRYGGQRLYIRHVLDHQEYDKGRCKEESG